MELHLVDTSDECIGKTNLSQKKDKNYSYLYRMYTKLNFGFLLQIN